MFQFKWLGSKIDKFNQVITEGNYRMPPMTWSRLIRGLNPEFQLPATSEVAVGTSMIDTGKSLGSRFMWATVVAAVTLTAIKWAAIGFAVVGAGVYTGEYYRAKKSREDEITEVNFAGQRVKGKRADLYRLHRAQLRIMNISDTIGADTETTEDAIQTILDSVKDERKRVAVLDPGRYNAGSDAYAFSEPDFRIVIDEKSLQKGVPQPLPQQAEPEPSLRAAWDSKRMTPDEVVDRLAEIEASLPKDMAEKLAQRRQAQKGTPGASS